MDPLSSDLRSALVDLLLSLADDKFFLGCRNSDWTGLGPMIEEDIAFSALAQDDIAHAKAIYEFTAGLTGDDANRLAFGRAAAEYRCAQIVELPDEFDWAFAIVRQCFCDHFDELRIQRLAKSSVKPLAELAERMLAEERLAMGHSDSWVVRLARGTEESRGRVAKALAQLAPRAGELFEPTAGLAALEQAGVYPPLKHGMFEVWSIRVEELLQRANLSAEFVVPGGAFRGGRSGVHSEYFAPWLTEISEVYRVEPNAQW
ncbi:MAG: 1,2-phenylacetyl-CoA epoxidase subunit PaaC [Phycisphaerae bacterium]|nr:1,2-phenylacetyl-CoA epoxidase subunit PaaC [Phycisphaerae bacterium]